MATSKGPLKHDYDSQAGAYNDYTSSPIGVLEAQLFAAALGDCRGLTVLDLGGGTGLKAGACAAGGAAAVDLVDLSPEMLQRAGGDVVRCHEGDATEPGLLDRLPGLRAPYDLVVVAWLFDHAHDRAELEAMWRNAVARLKPGGRFICIRSGDPLGRAALSGRYGTRYYDHEPIPGGLKYRYEILAVDPPLNFEGTSLEVMYSGSTEMPEKYGLTDIRTLPTEEAATVKADPALWQEFLENPYMVFFTARKKAEQE